MSQKSWASQSSQKAKHLERSKQNSSHRRGREGMLEQAEKDSIGVLYGMREFFEEIF